MKSFIACITFLLVFSPRVKAEEMSLSFVEKTQIEQLLLTQYYRWFHLFERPSSEQRINNHLAILSDDVLIRTFQGETNGHEGMLAFYNTVSDWQNTHHILETEWTTSRDNTVTFEADIIYQNILPNGERNNFSLHYVTQLSRKENALPVFTALDLQFRGTVEKNEFIDAYANNRVYSYANYLLAFLNGSVDEQEAYSRLFAPTISPKEQSFISELKGSLFDKHVFCLGEVKFSADETNVLQATIQIHTTTEQQKIAQSTQWLLSLNNNNDSAFLVANTILQTE